MNPAIPDPATPPEPVPAEPEEIIECASPPCLLGELGPDFQIEERKSLPRPNQSAYHLGEAVSIPDKRPPEKADS